MVLKGFVKKGEYFDSVSLMIVSKEVNALPGIADSAIVMEQRRTKRSSAARISTSPSCLTSGRYRPPPGPQSRQ